MALDIRSDKQSAEPFLQSSNDFERYLPDHHDDGRPTMRWRPYLIHTIAAIFYMTVLSIGVAMWNSTRECRLVNGGLYSPASEAVEYELRILPSSQQSHYDNNPFVGAPRPELDKAWADLLDNIHIRVSHEEFARMDLDHDSVALKDGSGYVVQLGVYHELHCLKYIRHWIHRDYYWANVAPDILEEHWWHTEHCLELFRLNSMCAGSLSPGTFSWITSGFREFGALQGIGALPNTTNQRECINWDKLDAWAADRRVDLENLELFDNLPMT